MGPYKQFVTHEKLSWGSKEGQIRSQCISNMIDFPFFSDFFYHFSYISPPPPKKMPFPLGFVLRTFFCKTEHFSDTKTVDNISQ